MIRNLKALGLALVAVFAMSAMAASAASAQEQGVLTIEKGGPASLLGVETGEKGANALTSFGETITCPGSTYSGEAENATTTVTVVPSYKDAGNNCRTSAGFYVTVTENNCGFIFHAGTTTPKENDEGTYGATVDVHCPEGQAIVVDVYLNSGHTIKLCELSVTDSEGTTNQGLEGLHLTHTDEKGDIDIVGEIKDQIVVSHASGACGEAATETEGDFKADVTVTAEDETGPVDLTISEEEHEA